MQKSDEFKIDLNAMDADGNTAFHVACKHRKTSVVELMLNNVEDFELDFEAIKDYLRRTGLKLDRESLNMDIVKLFTREIPNIFW